ncbi:MAG: PilZ domain-containing protein [Candidatus Omnitrophica bacterium]|nr:PilZ domain-containing protein [Candidatus Omnitrophota bacterium]
MENTERRRYPRIPVYYNVCCENADNPADRPVHAVAENASRTGLKLRFAGLLNRENLLRMSIQKTDNTEPIVCYGKVVWQKSSPLIYGETLAGINITRIGWTETNKLISDLAG